MHKAVNHQNKYCSYTLNIGQIEYASVTMPIIKEYCARYGITLYEITECKNEYPTAHWCKLDVFRQFLDSDHEYGLYLDIDIIIRKEAPNIFNEYNGGLSMTTDLDHNIGQWTDLWNYGKDCDFHDYYNTGVILFDKDSVAKILNHIESININSLKPDLLDQFYFNKWFQKLRIPIYKLDQKWNAASKFVTSMDEYYFIHYSTPAEKQILKKLDSNIAG